MNPMLISRLPKLLALAPILMAVAAPPACASDSKHATTETLLSFCDLPQVCQDIVRACHTKDDTTNAQIHECHETGHDVGTLEACTPIHDDCVRVCNAAPTLGMPEALPTCTDSGSSDAAMD